jgi:HTH-type transcriptional regulator/antitoxin HigA
MVTVIDIPTPHVLRTQHEYDTAVAEIDRLLDLDPTPFSADSDRLELLSVLVEDYEQRHDPIDDSDLTPVDLVQFMVEQKGVSRAELAEIMGGRSRLSDFLSGKRDLSKGQIQSLRDKLGIPADLLL